MNTYLQATSYLDYNHRNLKSFVASNTRSSSDAQEKIIELYYSIRDGFRYDPHNVVLIAEEFKASSLVTRKSGHCIHKAIILASCARSLNIPSRLGFARVRNHIGTESLERILRTNVLVPHGYVELYLNDQWVKATPAFNLGLCEKLGVAPLEFNGKEDSIFQEYNNQTGRFMEYLDDLGTYADVPLEFIREVIMNEYPHLFKN